MNKFIAFIHYSSTDQINSPDFLIIDSNENPGQIKYRHIYEKKIDGELLFLSCSLIAHYVFIFHGNETPIRQ